MKNKAIFLRLLQFIKYLTPQLCCAVFCAVAGFLITIAIPVYLLYIAFYVKLSWVHILVLCVLAILRGLFRYGEHYFGHYVAFRVLADFRKLVFNKLRRLSPGKLDSYQKGRLLKMIGEDIEALEVFFAHTLPPISTAIISSLILLVIFGQLNIYFMVIALVAYSLLAIVIPLVFSKKIIPLLKTQNETRNIYMSNFLESLKGMSELVQFNKVHHYFDRLTSQSKLVNQQERLVAQVSLMQNAISFLVIGLAITIMAYISFFNQNYFISIIGIIIFSTSFAPFLELARLPLGLRRAFNAADEIFSLLDEVEYVDTQVNTVDRIEDLAFNGVSFAYDKRDQLILDDISLKVTKNKIIGIVGKSGSGKSTLVKLLMKWYPAIGEIMINDTDLKTLNTRLLQHQICYIPQYPKIFNQTIRDNLTLLADIDDQTIEEVCRQCNIWHIIENSELQLDTMLNHESKIFSAGELQRLELARGFLKKANCYIFDEPTSNLDSLNEALFLKLIKENCHGDVFLISHRKSTMAICDEVYSVQNKKIVKEI